MHKCMLKETFARREEEVMRWRRGVPPFPPPGSLQAPHPPPFSPLLPREESMAEEVGHAPPLKDGNPRRRPIGSYELYLVRSPFEINDCTEKFVLKKY